MRYSVLSSPLADAGACIKEVINCDCYFLSLEWQVILHIVVKAGSWMRLSFPIP